MSTKQPVSMSLDQAFKRQRNRVLTHGSPEDRLRWERIVHAWKLVPSTKKTKMLQTESDTAQVSEIMSVLDETGALRKAIRNEMLVKEDAEKKRVDEGAAKVVLGLIFTVIVLTYVYIDYNNKARVQMQQRRAAAGLDAAEPLKQK